jgi:uncharacterized protein with ParB-like and HNH nuclease domain
MSLQNEIDLKAKEIHSDSYPMSIGEIVSIYLGNELDIHPDFQRFYRWTLQQKSRLIESILLGIPIPSIFVAQRDDGVWDVVDGLQRLSTIFEFMGILKNADGEIIPQLKLSATRYLPSLENKVWDCEDKTQCLSQTQRLIVKRSKLQIQIVKKESDKDTKYELFQRLNTGGTRLSDQEVRNCLLVMIDKAFFIWMKELSENPDFQNCISVSERAMNERYDMELVLRFLVYRYTESSEISRSTELNELLTTKLISFSEKQVFDKDKEKDVFTKTFQLLNASLGDNVFRKYSSSNDRFIGPFSISGFEAIIPGFSKYVDNYSATNIEEIAKTIKSIWDMEEFQLHSGAGLRAADRVRYLFPLSNNVFKK